MGVRPSLANAIPLLVALLLPVLVAAAVVTPVPVVAVVVGPPVVVSVAVNWAVGVDPRRRLLSLQTTAGSRQRLRYRRATTQS
jgi:hypothetical protein